MLSPRLPHTNPKLGKRGVGEMVQNNLTGDFPLDKTKLESMLRMDSSFDVIGRQLTVGGKKAVLYFVDGFAKDDIMEKIMEFLMSAGVGDLEGLYTAEAFSNARIPYVEADCQADLGKIVTGVLSGTLCLLTEGYDRAVMIDARTYPTRGVHEPDDDHVLRGSRDGFVETLVMNTALIRRRIRDPALTMDIMQIGRKSKTDVVLCYMDGAADETVLAAIRAKLQAIDVGTLTMAQESLAECLLTPCWYNPFPKIRYSERPDAVAASLVEGTIAILVDNSPSVMLLPTSFFDFFQGTNDYYFPPLVGSYLRLVRLAVFFLTLMLTPLWYLMVSTPELVPPWLAFVLIEEPNQVPILLQLLIIEFIIDGLKLASLNTPSVLSNSFSVVAALVLGDFAVQAGWFVPEVVLFMAFVAIANFAQPSFELGYAFKLFRVLLLILTALFHLWGLLGGLILLGLMLGFSRTVSGRCYLYPLIPFNGTALSRLLLRRKISDGNTR